MKRKLYGIELLKKLVNQEDLTILEVSSDDDLTIEEKIAILVGGERNCSSSK